MGKPLVLVRRLIYSAPGLVILVWNRFGAFSSDLVCLSHLVLHLLMNYTPRVGRGGSGKELLAPRNEPLVLKGLLKFLKCQLLSVHSVSHENRAEGNQQSWLRVGMSSGAGAVSTHHLWDL